MDTQVLIEQHGELLAIAGRIESLLNDEALRSDAASVRKLLDVLASRLTHHLAVEDDHIYRFISTSPCDEVRARIDVLDSEIRNLQAIYLAFNAKWNESAAIAADPAAFSAEARHVFGQLKHRIEKEERLLFPALENCESPIG